MITTISHCLLFHKQLSVDQHSPLRNKQVFASDSNNKDFTLILDYNYVAITVILIWRFGESHKDHHII